MSIFAPKRIPDFREAFTLSDRRREPPPDKLPFIGHLGEVLAGLPPRVLIWEGDLPIRMQLRGVFRDAGCIVDAPELPSQAFHEIETEEFDLVMVRYSEALISADKIEFAPWARISPPFILYDDEDRRAAARELGFEGYRSLPIMSTDARHLIQQYVFGNLTGQRPTGV